jgi:AcrR family transcriptional regulator
MPRDSTETKRRVLDAAYREFAAHGLAGARVDRIAAAAGANKRAIYDYFGNKEQLFDLVVVDRLLYGMETVPDTWDDLAQYTENVFDYYAADRDRARLTLWRQLERPDPTPAEIGSYRDKLAAMRAARPAGERIPPEDLYAVFWALHHTAILYPHALIAAAGSTPQTFRESLRTALRTAADRLTSIRDPDERQDRP